MTTYCTIKTPAGPLLIAGNDKALTHLCFHAGELPPYVEQGETPVLNEAANQLAEYFAGKRTAFTVSLQPAGTEFQKRVWQALTEIPFGETTTYGNLAAAIGNPKGARAVGLANNRNPIPIFIPCHRVVGANGSLTGYRGGLQLKQILLDLENRYAHI